MQSPPAQGAPIEQVIGASAVAALLIFALLYLGYIHRTGKSSTLTRVSDFTGSVLNLPSFVALPVLITTISLITAAFGFYWDVSLHIDDGRDAGPLANPAHYFILLGLFGIFTSGWLAIILPKDILPGPHPIRIKDNFFAPIGGLVLMLSGTFALIGFPLDDLSHRIFGQDVTLWGPTHLMMLTGALVSLIGILILLKEGTFNKLPSPNLPKNLKRITISERWMRVVRVSSACGGFLVALSIYQGEFDFGVPQFRLLLAPVLVVMACGIALSLARLLLGKGGAIIACSFYLLLRGAMSLIIAVPLEESVNHFLPYIFEALIVEGVALAFGRNLKTRPYLFGIISGCLIATLGCGLSALFTYYWAAIPWPLSIYPEVLIYTIPTGIFAGIIGVFIASALKGNYSSASGKRIIAAWSSLIGIFLIVAFLIPTENFKATATIHLVEESSNSVRMVSPQIKFSRISEKPEWLYILAWQGGGKLVNEPLIKTTPGIYTTKNPIPVSSTWKTLIRYQEGNYLSGVPIWLPEDKAIPAKEIPAESGVVREFVPDRNIVQREIKQNTPAYLFNLAGLLVAGAAFILFSFVGWGLSRLARPVEKIKPSKRGSQ